MRVHEVRAGKLLVEDGGEQEAEPADRSRNQQQRHDAESKHPAEVESHAARERQRTEDCHGDRVHRGNERPEPRVDDAGCQEELKRIRRQVEQVQKERDRAVQTAEERQQPRAKELRVVAQPQ